MLVIIYDYFYDKYNEAPLKLGKAYIYNYAYSYLQYTFIYNAILPTYQISYTFTYQ